MNNDLGKLDLKEILSRCCVIDLQDKTIVHLKNNLVIYMILVLGFIIRLYGVQFGLPGLYHADETIVVNHALAYGTGDLNPHFFRIPPLISYLIFFEYGIYYLLGTVFGFFSTIVDFQNLFLENPTSFYLIGRITVGVIAGTVSVYFIYILGERVFSKTVGTISAFFLSLTFLHVRNSHYIYLDTMLVLFIILTYIFIFKFLETGLRRNYILAGSFAGVATAVKYNAALLLVPLILGHLMYYLTNKNSGKIRLVNKDIILAFIFMALTFIALNPFCIIDMKFFLASFVSETHVQGGVGFFHHLKHSLFQGLGMPLFVLSLIGLFYSLCKLSRKLIVFISFPLVFFLTIVNFSQPHARYVLPLIPFLMILAAWFLESTLFKEGMPSLKAKILITAVSIMVVLPSGIKSVYSDYLFSRKDTRTLAKEWIEDKIN
jgi:4-amino-4-deoxy-L-arabinose transferase-like glycosyltransferase